MRIIPTGAKWALHIGLVFCVSISLMSKDAGQFSMHFWQFLFLSGTICSNIFAHSLAEWLVFGWGCGRSNDFSYLYMQAANPPSGLHLAKKKKNVLSIETFASMCHCLFWHMNTFLLTPSCFPILANIPGLDSTLIPKVLALPRSTNVSL